MVVQSLPITIPKFWHEIHNPFNLSINHLALGRRERCSCFISAHKSHGIPGLICSLFASEIGLDFVLCGYCLQSLLWSQKGLLLIEWQRVCPVNGRGSLAFLSSTVKPGPGITAGSDWVTLINVHEVPGGSSLPSRAAVLDEPHVWSRIHDVLGCSEGWWWFDGLGKPSAFLLLHLFEVSSGVLPFLPQLFPLVLMGCLWFGHGSISLSHLVGLWLFCNDFLMPALRF